jgi:hypothetical protein
MKPTGRENKKKKDYARQNITQGDTVLLSAIS